MSSLPGGHQPPITEERLAEILRRIRVRRRRAQLRAGIAAVTAIAVVASIGLPRLLDRSGAHGVQSLRVTSSQTPSAPPANTPTSKPSSSPRFGSRIPEGSGPLVLETMQGRPSLIVRLGSSDPPYRIRYRRTLGEPVTDPAGGWIVVSSPSSRTGRGLPPARLATVDARGHVQAFGPTTPPGEGITGLAVSPDGARVAVSLRGFTSASNALAHVTVLPAPGHSGGERTWTLHPADLDSQIGSLSWAPDGRHLTYIATNTTGGGFSGAPLTMDTQGSGSTIAPPTDMAGCDQDMSAGWLGTTGHFAAVLDRCNGLHRQFVVSDAPGQPAIRPVVAFGDRGCQAGDFSATNDGTQILVPCDSTLYLIHAQRVRALAGSPGNPAIQAAFAGGAG